MPLCAAGEIPHLTRSALHRCSRRYGISCLPLTEEGPNQPEKKYKDNPIVYLHINFAEVQIEGGCQYFFVATDRTSKVVRR